MKKILFTVLLFVFLSTSIFAYSNQQKIYSVDSNVYQALETLYLLAGRSLPSSSGPYSEAELSLMLSSVKNSIPAEAHSYYSYVEGLITSEPKLQYEDSLGLSFGLDLALEGYYHTNEKFDDYDKWFHSHLDREPVLNFRFEAWPTNNMYGYFEFPIQHCLGYDTGRASGNGLYRNSFNTNIPVVNALLLSMPSEDNFFADFDWTVPYRAFVSVGGAHWNFMAGRDRLSWGSGETGNLMLSDSFPKHTMVRFNTFFEKFKYSIVGSMFPATDSQESQYKSLNGFKALIAHRLEFNMFNNKFGLVINEACMYWSVDKDNQNFNLGQINPFGFMHNEYVAGNGNSLLVFEANYTPINGINVYGQFALDEFSGPGEKRTNPAASGFLAGLKAAHATNNGIITASFEFAKTDPFLYIRGLHYQENPDPAKIAENDAFAVGYGYDALFRTISSDRIILERMFVSYKYGNDVILYDGKINYEIPNVVNFGLECLFLTNGSMDVNSKWHMYRAQYDNAPDIKTPTTFNPFEIDDYDPSTNTVKKEHAIEKSTILSFTVDYNITKSLSAKLAADCLIVKNYNNVKDNNQNDLQVSLGIKYSI